ncbi:MAG: hypothetical protein KC422_02000 [Trueperaceae bacterium]|nr:hypothetical protein [Trueperaceae bacterium]
MRTMIIGCYFFQANLQINLEHPMNLFVPIAQELAERWRLEFPEAASEQLISAVKHL